MPLFQHHEDIAKSVSKGLWGVTKTPVRTDDVTNTLSVNQVLSESKDDQMVYVTKSGKKYHREGCKWGNIPITLEEAKERYSPCKKCW